MNHSMNLVPLAFKKIADGSKSIELRLNDEKRKRIRVNDTIIFNCNGNLNIIAAKVKALHCFEDFKACYKQLPLDKCGYSAEELSTANHMDMERYYSKEQIKKYGALGIELCDICTIRDVKKNIYDPLVLELLAPSVYNPTPERLMERAKKYQASDQTKMYGHSENGEYNAIVVFEVAEKTATILDIAVKPEHQGNGIGSKLIEFIFNRFETSKVLIETDDDAIGFYIKYGFTVSETNVKFNTNRYVCACDSITHHYNLLIVENNDPVHDPEPLQDYMNKWDGPAFIEQMQLDNSKSVLEIGVGTGRLAVRVAPLCGEFYGIDISPKTTRRAKENLAEFTNVRLTCANFLSYKFDRSFDVVYSSLTFMHIEDKQKAVNRIAGLLNDAGRFVLSIDKNPSEFIDTGTRKIKIYPDTADEIAECIRTAELTILNQYDTEFASVFVAQKDR